MKQNFSKTLSDGVYVQPAKIAKLYGIGRTTVWRLLNEMKASSKYQYSFKDLGWKLKLVKLEDFEAFLNAKSKTRLRG